MRESIKSFYALGRVSKGLNSLVKEASGEFIKAFLKRFGSLGRRDFRNVRAGFNFDLSDLKKGFNLYVKDPCSKFSRRGNTEKVLRELVENLVKSK